MTAGPAEQAHVPVLLAEVLAAFAPGDGAAIVDGTFGAGGYTRAILDVADTTVIAIDRDPDAIAEGQALADRHAGRLSLVQDRFSQLDRIAVEAGHPLVDGVVLDIGVSSMQLDQARRGFSFMADGPLDMRMAQSGGSAADLVNTLGESELADILYRYGEERASRRIARAIVKARSSASITRTAELAEIVAGCLPPKRKPGDKHPATRTFQALRIAVNDELGELEAGLDAAERCLKPGGVLAIVTFHSLEDRMVKQFLAARSGRVGGGSRHQPPVARAEPTFSRGKGDGATAGEAECAANPRARSARLRVGIRTEAPARGT